MKSYLSLIPISAKVRKRQNRMTVLCIIISVFLVTAIFSVADMMIRTESDFMISNHGNWHIAIKNISQNNADEISNRSDVTAVGVASQFNFEGEQPYRVNEKRTVLYGTDEVYITQISNGIVEGTFPANDEEVMLTPNSVTALGVQLGDSVTLHTPAGDRTFTISGFGTDDESYYNNQTYLIGSYLTQSAFTSVMAQNGVTNNELTKELLLELEKTNRFTEQALYYARSEHTEKDYSVREMALSQVVHQAIADNKYLLLQGGMRLEVEEMQDTVYSDEKWVRFILNQLIANAVKYRTEQPVLRISTHKRQDQVILVVEDNGIGIAASDLPRIFEKGFTGQNGRMIQQSTGIGLYLCKRLCEKLGIGIAAESSEQGTAISLAFHINCLIHEVQG